MNQAEIKRLAALKERYGFNMGRDAAIIMPCVNTECPCSDLSLMRCAAPEFVVIDLEGMCPVWRRLNEPEATA